MAMVMMMVTPPSVRALVTVLVIVELEIARMGALEGSLALALACTCVPAALR